MATGTITELDVDGQVGLIDGDDGRVILFNLHGLAPAKRRQFGVGTRVKFAESPARLGSRAVCLAPLEPRASH